MDALITESDIRGSEHAVPSNNGLRGMCVARGSDGRQLCVTAEFVFENEDVHVPSGASAEVHLVEVKDLIQVRAVSS